MPEKYQGATILQCEVFQAGTHRDEPYTLADLDAICANFARAGESLKVPMVAGHEETQPLVDGETPAGQPLSYLDNTGIPAVGWVTRLYRQGSKLFADFAGVLPAIAKLIAAGLYRKVSAEIYDEPPEGMPATCQGKMLRRVAILGGEIPQVKSLADIPLPQGFSERQAPGWHDPKTKSYIVPVITGWRLGKTTAAQRKQDGKRRFLRVFSEVAMDRAQMEQALLAAGWAQDEIDAIKDDAALGAVVAHEMKKASGAAPEPAEPADVNMEPPSPPAPEEEEKKEEMQEPPTPEQMVAELVAMGMDEATVMAMQPDELMALWQEKKGATMAATAPSQTVNRPALPADRQPSKVVFQYTELEKRAKRIEAEIAKAETLSKKRLAEEKLAAVKSFCERMIAAGKMLPAEVEGGAVDFALSLDAVTVHKFSDGKQATQLDRWMSQIEARPELVKFGERMKQPKQAQSDDVAKVKRFSEQPHMVKALAAKGVTSEEWARRFEELKKKDPKLTPAAYGVPDNFAA